MNAETDFSIRRFIGGFDKNLTYLITCNKTRVQVLVDAAIPISHILPFIFNDPVAILVTHTHKDHINYINEYIKCFPDITILGHPKSTPIFKKKKFKIINSEQNFKIKKLSFSAIHTPGHYFDSVCYLLKPVLFTGDTLFVGRTGRIKNENSDIEELYNSIYKKILTLPDHLRIYPGHDYGNKITIQIKENKKISPLLRAKNLEDFIKRMKDYELKRTPNT